MGRYFDMYKGSFAQPWKRWLLILVDFGLVGLIMLLFSFFSGFVQSKVSMLMGGMSPEQFKALAASGVVDQIVPFATDLRSFAFVALAIGFVLIVLSLLLFSFSRGYLWKKLVGKKFMFKEGWKWFLLHLALIVPAILYGFISIIVIVIAGGFFQWFFTFIPSLYYLSPVLFDSLILISNTGVKFLATMFALLIFFFVHYHFTQGKGIWKSIELGFKEIKVKWRYVWRALLLIVLTAVVITGLLVWLKSIYWQGIIVLSVIQSLFSFFFLHWIRLYSLKIIDAGRKR